MDKSAPRKSPRQALVARTLVERRDGFVRFLQRKTLSKADAEELLQQASMRALEHADDLRDPKRVEAWIYRILRRTVIDTHRATRGDITPNVPEVIHAEPPRCTCSLTLMAALKPEYQIALQRVEVEGLSVSILALELGISPNNATVRLHRARRALRDRLQQHCGVQSIRQCLDCPCEVRGCCTV